MGYFGVKVGFKECFGVSLCGLMTIVFCVFLCFWFVSLCGGDVSGGMGVVRSNYTVSTKNCRYVCLVGVVVVVRLCQ